MANNVGESLARGAAAAGELLTDSELRSKSMAVLTESAKKAGGGVAKGFQQGAGRIAQGPRTVQGILQKLQQRIEEQRLQALLREQQDAPVDVQVAFQLYEDAPQELRSRLWMALLEHPELVADYQRLALELQQERQQATAAGTQPSLTASQQQEERGGVSGAGDAGSAVAVPVPATAAHVTLGQAGPSVELWASTEAMKAAAAGSSAGSSQDDYNELNSPSDPAHLSSSYSAPWAAHRTSPGASGSSVAPGGPRLGHVQQEEEGEWHLVSDQAAAWKLQGAPLLAAQQPAYSREREGFRNELMQAMMALPWPLPTAYPPDCKFATLQQINIGQEDIDEVITRDLHRTFPEHALLSLEQGQELLYHVLKAYAVHDLEVSYCQGMAFVAGLCLMSLPEEPAFQLFCRLMSTSGPNLRRLYLPGLEGLKSELRRIEYLSERFLPNLTAHLNEAGVVPVLYASQWLLTCYSCPFPISFACRVVDIMLQENRDHFMLKVALAILAECEGDLLMQEGFEALLTHLKTDVLTWPHYRLRRVLNAALASPVGPRDLADADAALQQGYSGSLSRAPTFSGGDEAAATTTSELAGEAEGAAAGDGGAAPRLGRESRSASLASQPSAAGAAAVAAAAAAGGPADEDTVTADLAAAQQRIDDELMQLVLNLDLEWAGTDDTYSNTLQRMGSAPDNAAV